MKAFLRTRLIQTLVVLVFIAASVAIPLVFPGSHSRAAAPPSHEQAVLAALAAKLPLTFRPLPHSSHPVTMGHPSISINPRDDGRLLYVDAGSCPGPDNSGDSIDVYRIFRSGLVHVGNFPTGGCLSLNGLLGGGTQDLDVTPANSTHGPCLVYISLVTSFISSFSILPTGALGTEVSHLTLGGLPLDVHVARNGGLVYVNTLNTLTPPSVLSSYSLGTGCVLTALASLTTNHLYISLTLINASKAAGADITTGTIDTYDLTTNGGISALNSVPGQLSSAGAGPPISIVTLRLRNDQQDVFTGQFASGGAPQVQGGQVQIATGAITFLRRSPASDPSGANGLEIFADNDHMLLIQGEVGSHSLGVYNITSGPGHLGRITFLQHMSLATGGGGVPVGFGLVDNTLFVAAGLNGDVEACQITSNGVSDCTTAAVLTDSSAVEGGIVLL